MASHLMLAHQIAEIKTALKRKAYESDSDESITHNSNRGQKLRKRARYTTRGQLAPATSPQVYREEIEYAGVKRRIIDRNPTPVDDEGYPVDGYCSDERQQEARSNVADLNPYASVHLERILAPLTSVTDLPDHPTLSAPFRSRTLAELSGQASELTRREQKSLWKVRKLMIGLCGDFTWLPCGPLVGPNDIDLFTDNVAPQERRKKRPLLPDSRSSSAPMPNGDKNVSVDGSVGATTSPPSDSAAEKAQAGDDVPLAQTRLDTNSETRPSDGAGKEKSHQQETNASPKDVASDKNLETEASVTADKPTAQESGGLTDEAAGGSKDDGTDPDKTEDIGMQDANQPDTAKADTAEKDANGEAQQAPPADPEDEVVIHPFFNPPAYPLPDRDLGLPENEAENVRHLMSLYVQKQEEIARGAAKLHQGLMKADRLRATVLQWAKAEAHVGEMSDGEDWYDKEEWRLEGELKKGQDEEEEDTTQPVKKTRNRRQ